MLSQPPLGELPMKSLCVLSFYIIYDFKTHKDLSGQDAGHVQLCESVCVSCFEEQSVDTQRLVGNFSQPALGWEPSPVWGYSLGTNFPMKFLCLYVFFSPELSPAFIQQRIVWHFRAVVFVIWIHDAGPGNLTQGLKCCVASKVEVWNNELLHLDFET